MISTLINTLSLPVGSDAFVFEQGPFRAFSFFRFKMERVLIAVKGLILNEPAGLIAKVVVVCFIDQSLSCSDD